jgi:hypothetical protein
VKDETRVGGDAFGFAGRAAARFTRRYRLPPEHVWRAIATRDALNAWFLPMASLDEREGGTYTVSTTEGNVEGKVTAYQRPHVLAFDDLRFELHDDPAGCRLEFTVARGVTGWTPGILAGFHAMLDGLAAYLEGRTAREVAYASGGWRRYYRTYEREIATALAGGAPVVFRAHFALCSAELDDAAYAVLRDAAALLTERAALLVIVDGHSDDDVADDEAVALSRQRADAATHALVLAGVALERIVPRAFGAEFRLRRADDAETRAFNRRVEVIPAY